MARGRGRGLGGRRGKAAPPFPEGIDRQFITRNDHTLPDNTGNGRDAEVYGEASYFNDAKVIVPNLSVDFSTGFKITIRAINLTFGARSGIGINGGYNILNGFGLNYFGGKIYCNIRNSTGFNDIGLPISSNFSGIIEGEWDGSNLSIKVNEIVLSVVKSGIINDSVNLWYIGSQLISNPIVSGMIVDVSVYDKNNNIAFICPLPHTGVGFDANGDTVPLTVEGGVSSAIVKGGSLWNHDHGCIERNPELIVNGDNLINTDNWISQQGAILSVENGALKVENSANDYGKAYQGFPTVIGKTYAIPAFFNVSSPDTSFNYHISSTPLGSEIIGNANADVARVFTATTNTTYIRLFAGANIIGNYSTYNNISIKLATPSYIPNKPDNTPAFPLQEGDIVHHPTAFLNGAPFGLILYTVGDTDPEYTFWNKSQPHWKQALRDKETYRAGETGFWSYEDLLQAEIYLNCEDPEKYKGWIKRLPSGMYKDIFYYRTALQPDDDLAAAKYCKSVIPYEHTEGSYLIQEGAYYIIP